MEETKLSGYVFEITYRNEKNRYTVFDLRSGEDLITCVGYLPAVNEGEPCEVTGTFVEHPVYGRQFRLSSYAYRAPEGTEAVERYLGSGAVKGVGKKLAARIVAAFGEETMRILNEEPERLSEIRGISERGAREIAGQLEKQKDERDAMIYLARYGIGGTQAARIWEAYGNDLYRVLKENPYRLASDIEGIGFLTADDIARRMGIQPDSEYRARSGLLYVLSQGLAEGNTCMTREGLLAEGEQLLSMDREELSLQLDNLAMDRKVRIAAREDETYVFLMQMWEMEGETARMLLDLDSAASGGKKPEDISEKIAEIEKEEHIHLDDLQRQAVTLAATGGVLLISGGPGTGKTTTINAILDYFDSCEETVLLAAPTGRAAKRMTEATGRDAQTIHRLLEYHAMDGEDSAAASEYRFERDDGNPLEASVVVIDEMSMVDIWLFHALLKALRKGTKLILVGDANQLPSVGPGRVLQDILESHAFRQIILKKIFRQAAESDIVMNAHRILNGEKMQLDNRSRDFFFLPREDARVIYKHLVVLMTEKLPRYVDADTEEIQVLTPMKKGALGTVTLNAVLQSVLNPRDPKKAEHEAHDTVFREGDKVMQTRNDYQLAWQVLGNFGLPLERGTGIFNGEFGKIRSIDEEGRMMQIVFDGQKTVDYPFENLDSLELAYAITVHKAQGSEYPAVLIPLLGGPKQLLTRNLLYTAVTRAKKCVVILGSREALENMEANTQETRRLTGLKDRINELVQFDGTDDGSVLPEEMPGL